MLNQAGVESLSRLARQISFKTTSIKSSGLFIQAATIYLFIDEGEELTKERPGFPYILKTAKKQTLLYVYRRHYIEAAKQFLLKDNQWWTIKIFLVKSKGLALASFDLSPLLTVPADKFEKLGITY